MLGASQAALLSTVAFVKQSYADTVTALLPVAYWHLGELGGTTIVDEKAVQNGTYQGTVEFGLEPIVQNSIGTSVGFDGSSTYGQIPHNPAFELASFTVDFAFQADSAPAAGTNRILISKDIPDPAPAGALSIEIYNNAGQLKLRAYAGGAAGPVWIDSSDGVADLEVATAYKVTLTVDAATGAKLYLNGVEVASEPTSTTGLTNNTEPFVVGAYSTSALAKFDGVLDEIALFDRALSSSEVESLATPRTIDHSGGSANTIPLSAPPGTTFWVAPGGTGNGSSAGNPAGSWVDILNGAGHRAVVAGDIIAVLGGSYFNERDKTVTSTSGTVGSPIQIVGYHPDGQTRPRIDNSHPDFRGGSPSTPLSVWQPASVGGFDVWETVGTGYGSVMTSLQAYGDPRDNELRFCGYEEQSGWDAMRSTNVNSYSGPGVFKGNGSQGTNGRLYIAVEPGKFAAESNDNFPSTTSGSSRNPNHMDLKLVWQTDTMLTLNGCSHLHFYNHEWSYSRTIMKLRGLCVGLKFHYIELRGGFRGVDFIGTITNSIWQWCRVFHGLPHSFQWRDAKSSAHPFGQYVGGTQEFGSQGSNGAVLRDNWWLNCTFERSFDVMVWLDGDVRGNKYLNCNFLYCRDDNLDYENSIAEEEIGYCLFFGCFAPFSWRGGNDVSNRLESQLRYYIHHTVFHMIYSLYQRSHPGGYTTEPVTAFDNARVPMSVSTEHSGAERSRKCRNFAHCTLIYGGSKGGPTLADRMSHWKANQALTIPGWSMNNIIICKHWDCIGYDVVDEFMRDGDCLHHINPSSGRLLIKNVTNRSWTKSFSTLSAAVSDSQVRSASDPLPYPGGGTWMQNSIVNDPQLGSKAYDLVSQPRQPYAASVYKPSNFVCASGARDLSSLPPQIMWGTASNPTRTYSYQAFRGAIDPSGDGSEIGPQPMPVLPA